MGEAAGNTLPWFGRRDTKKTTTASETTSGGEQPTRLVPVAVNLNPGEAAVIKGRLESENIPAFAQQEAIGSVMGLTVGPLGSAKVLVPEPLAERALSILAETYDQTIEDDFNDEAEQ